MDASIVQDEDQFFDSREEISSVSDAGSDCSDNARVDSHCFLYEAWTRNLEGVHERRRNFLRSIGLDLDRRPVLGEELEDLGIPSDGVEVEVDRVTENSGAVLRTLEVQEEWPSSRDSITNSMSTGDLGSLEICVSTGSSACTIKNLDDGTEYVLDEVMGEDGLFSTQRIVGSNQFISMEEFQRNLGPSPLVQQLFRRCPDNVKYLNTERKKMKRGWLRTLGSMACMVDNHGVNEFNHKYVDSTVGLGMQRVRVHPYKKRFKELSSLFIGQEFLAHNGPILTMKFSPDGQYLATGGEDGVVRVWKVVEDVEFDIPDTDPSCMYFKMDKLSHVAPVHWDKLKLDKMEKSTRSSDLTCVVVPPKVFQVLDKPLHEFQGHSGEILDLSWSKQKFLLSSSVDHTVRLWQVGLDRCLRVFLHNNYVTSVDFNHMDDNLFISGSIDGKIRIWEVLHCQVIDYIDIHEIVTAVSYRPDGKGGIVGTMAGSCYLYNIEDNHLQLDAQLCLLGKKKTPGKRIIRFEFSPSDPNKVMVISADSVVRILCGVDIICKFKGSQMAASFTSDGKHIVAIGEDSNVCIWNYASQDRTSFKAKKVWSSESFLSHSASIAIPWNGIDGIPGTLLSQALNGDMWTNNSPANVRKPHNMKETSLSSPDCFSLSRGFLDSLPKGGSATWPEEKLLESSSTVVSPTTHKSGYKFLRNACQGISNSHLWGLMIVTAGWDGRVRVYHNYGLPIRT